MSAKKLTILQVLPALNSGGVERGTIEMTRAISNAGWNALVASSGGMLASSIERAGGKHITLPLDKKQPWNIWLNSKTLKKLIKEHNIDIVHARSRGPAWSAHFATHGTDTHFITTFHGKYAMENAAKQRYNSIMAKGEKVIAISHFIAKHVREYYGTPKENMEIIHRGVDLELFNPSRVHPQRLIQLSSEWRLPEDLPVILMPGRITRWKGHDTLIEALAMLPHRNFAAVLLGDDTQHPNYRKELETLISNLDLEGAVRFVSPTQLMPEAYTLARFVVTPSSSPEAFGRIPVEAMAMGRPIIATKHGGFCETVLHDETGWLVEPGNKPALARIIEHALSLSEDTIEKIGARGTERAQQFSIQHMCDATLALYKSVA